MYLNNEGSKKQNNRHSSEFICFTAIANLSSLFHDIVSYYLCEIFDNGVYLVEYLFRI